MSIDRNPVRPVSVSRRPISGGAEHHMRRVLDTIDASDDGVFIFDERDLRYRYVNAGAGRLVGYGCDELLGMTPLDLSPGSDRSEYRALIEGLHDRPEEVVVRRATLLHHNGAEVEVEETYKAAPAGADGTRWVIALARDITDRLAAEDRVRSDEYIEVEADRVLSISADRERIARDLHDTVIQRLFGAGLNLQALAPIADDRVRLGIETTIDDLDATIRDLRSAIFSLHVRSLIPGGVRGRILQVLEDAHPALGFEPRVEFAGLVESLDDGIVDNLIPILREALSNVARHAAATAVRVSLSVTDEVSLTVLDDGVGVDGHVFGGYGVDNMTSRAHQMGGSLHIAPGLVEGSELICLLPMCPTPT